MKTYKLITFVPTADTEKVLKALGDAGAGAIGNYTHCSFVSRGHGRFLPGKGANPAIGEVGKIEVVEEDKIETVCTEDKIKEVIKALKEAHPYEEVAYDLLEEVDIEAV
jgi:hypothetical protein